MYTMDYLEMYNEDQNLIQNHLTNEDIQNILDLPESAYTDNCYYDKEQEALREKSGNVCSSSMSIVASAREMDWDTDFRNSSLVHQYSCGLQNSFPYCSNLEDSYMLTHKQNTQSSDTMDNIVFPDIHFENTKLSQDIMNELILESGKDLIPCHLE